MSVTDFLGGLESSSRSQAAAILAEAEARAARIRSEAESQATDACHRRLAQCRADLQAAAARELMAVRQQARRQMLEAREELLERVRRAARTELSEVDGDERWRRGLSGELQAALAYLGPAPAVVRCRPPMEELVREALPEGAPARVEATPEAPPGLLVEAEDGSLTVDVTLTGRLQRRFPAFRRLILDRLGEPP